MAESDDGFVSRWSKRKRAAREPEPAEAPAPAGGADAPAEAREDDIVAQLPDVESLDETSDFSVFLREGVPDAIRRKALRKLWRLNPVLANLDGLNDYDEDFTDAATVIEGLKTLYRAGRGFLDESEGEAEPAAAGAGEAAPGVQSVRAADIDTPSVEEAQPETLADEAADDDQNAQPGTDPTPAATQKAETRRKRSARSRRWGDFPSS